MRVLLVHNFYLQPGGEDQVFRDEGALLIARGHELAEHTVRNDEIEGRSRLGVGLSTVWSRRSVRVMRGLVEAHRPQVVHFHNTLPLVSPSAYYAARRGGAAVVQTLHNYRLICPGSLLFREGRVCEDCVGRAVPWPGVAYRCYRGSVAASAAVTAMIAAHRLAGTWRRQVDQYVALTHFQRSAMERGGLPAERISVKPNFVADLGAPSSARGPERRGGLFVGRLTPEKGIAALLAAWRVIENRLVVIGDGPMRGSLTPTPNVEFRGPRSLPEVAAAMRSATFLVVPSEWYEAFPRVIVEAFRAGLPVIASRLGSLEEIVSDGVTGLFFRAGDAVDLAERIRWALAHEADMRAMGARARSVYEERYTPEANYPALMEIYARAIERRASVPARRDAAIRDPG